MILSLVAGSYFDSLQLKTLSETFKNPDTQTAVLIPNLALSLLSVGAPVWFAWLLTKQIGQRFRFSEYYAFKASVSRAYEGFRREAARFDKEMGGVKLLSSALIRLDELPLRLVEAESHGSPWHEIASSNTVKQAVRTVPNFAEQVKGLAAKALAVPQRGKTQPKPKSEEDETE